MTMDPQEFVGLVKGATSAEQRENPYVRLATIDPAYAAGRPRVTFDGESTLSARTYTYLSSYAPAAGHRVMMLRAGSTWVVLGRIT